MILFLVYPLSIFTMELRNRHFLMGSYVFSAICSLPKIYVYQLEYHPIFKSAFAQCTAVDFYRGTSRHVEQIYEIASLALMYFVPLISILLCYVGSYRSLGKACEDPAFEGKSRRFCLLRTYQYFITSNSINGFKSIGDNGTCPATNGSSNNTHRCDICCMLDTVCDRVTLATTTSGK